MIAEMGRSCRDEIAAHSFDHCIREGSVVPQLPFPHILGADAAGEDAKFGLPGIALRTLELYTTATLEATLKPAENPIRRWRERMQQLADSSRADTVGRCTRRPSSWSTFDWPPPRPSSVLGRRSQECC